MCQKLCSSSPLDRPKVWFFLDGGWGSYIFSKMVSSWIPSQWPTLIQNHLDLIASVTWNNRGSRIFINPPDRPQELTMSLSNKSESQQPLVSMFSEFSVWVSWIPMNEVLCWFLSLLTYATLWSLQRPLILIDSQFIEHIGLHYSHPWLPIKSSYLHQFGSQVLDPLFFFSPIIGKKMFIRCSRVNIHPHRYFGFDLDRLVELQC